MTDSGSRERPHAAGSAPLRELLVNVLLDETWRSRASEDLEGVMEAHGLPEEHRVMLRAGGEGVLRALGLASDLVPEAAPLPPPPVHEAGHDAGPVHLPELALLVRAVPQTVEGPEGTRVQWLASLHAASPGEAAHAGPAGPPPRGPGSDWGHRTDGAEVLAAAEAVRAASPGERYDRILELLAAVAGAPNG